MVVFTNIIINDVDITEFIAFRGVKWSLRYVNGKNGGLTLDGTTQLDVLATKVDLNIDIIPLVKNDLNTLLPAIAPEIVTVQYDDPLYGSVTKTMHPTGQSLSFLAETSQELDAQAMWGAFSFKLEEL